MSQEKHAPQGSMRSCVIFVEMSASLSSSLQSVVMEQLVSHIFLTTLKPLKSRRYLRTQNKMYVKFRALRLLKTTNKPVIFQSWITFLQIMENTPSDLLLLNIGTL